MTQKRAAGKILTAKEFTKRVLLSTLPPAAPPFFTRIISADFTHHGSLHSHATALIRAFDGRDYTIQVDARGYLWLQFDGYVIYENGAWRFQIDSHKIYDDNWGLLLVNAAGEVTAKQIDAATPADHPLHREITKVDFDEWQQRWDRRPIDPELHLQDMAYWYNCPETGKTAYQSADNGWRSETGLFIEKLLKKSTRKSSKRVSAPKAKRT